MVEWVLAIDQEWTQLRQMETYMIGSQHEDHLEELGRVRWQSSLEPEKRHNSFKTDILLEDIDS